MSWSTFANGIASTYLLNKVSGNPNLQMIWICIKVSFVEDYHEQFLSHYGYNIQVNLDCPQGVAILAFIVGKHCVMRP